MDYRPVFQRWSLIRATAKGGACSAVEGGCATAVTVDSVPTVTEATRHRMQRLRIGKRISISELAETIKCDVDLMAAYERGDAVLDAKLVVELQRVLGDG